MRTVHYTGAHQCTPVFFTGAPLHAPIHHTDAHRCTLSNPQARTDALAVQLTGAPFGRALNSPHRAPMRAYLVDRRAHMRAYHPIAHACGAQTP
jgi:hypothetical protein